MSGMFRWWFRKPTTAERLARYGLRPDTVAAADAMVSDPRSDPYVAKVDSSLTESETVLRLVEGWHDRAPGLVVLTSARVFFRARRSDGPLAFSTPLTDVISISGATRKVLGTLRITTANGDLVVDRILGTQGEMLAADAQQAMRGHEARPSRDPLEVLAELRTLRDSGVIDAEEFETRKAALWRDI